MDAGFRAKVDSQVESLDRRDWQVEERRLAAKRVAWARDGHVTGTEPSPRAGYELLIRQYLGLSADQAPIVSESDEEIAWASINPCPTLEACSRLDLDTRKVCRRVNEKPTQALISQLDPRLRFCRDYDRLRPHGTACSERIVKLDFEALMGIAIEEALLSRREGNKGYGAVVMMGAEMVGRAHDTAASERDPSLHAEVNAIRQAARSLGQTDLCGAVVISTCEPCPMCSSLAVWANVTSMVYGASIRETAAAGKARIRVDARQIVDSSPVMVEVIGGIRRAECCELYF